jgi:hypothetical protein
MQGFFILEYSCLSAYGACVWVVCMIFARNILLSIGKAYKGAILTVTRNLILCTFSGLMLCPIIGVAGVMYEGLIADAGSAILSYILIRSECRKLDNLIVKRK